jgi:hypothetical protein
MPEEIEKFKEHFSWIHKLHEYELEYTCDDDCVPQGCPGHIAKFKLWHVTDSFEIELHDQTIHLDGTQFAMILDFAKRLTK